MPIKVRAATLEDAERLADLATQLGYASTVAQMRERLAALPQDGCHALFVAEKDGFVAGWVHVLLLPTLESEMRGEVAGMVVDKSYRRSGIGRLLMERAEDWTREKGVRLIGLRSNIIRNEAHAFYESLGYSRIKTQYAYRKKL